METVMAGIVSFTSLPEAIRAGFQVYDRTSDGYLVRTRTSVGWALAVVTLI
jgi:Ca2+-binding EF-hand superfamily protein